MNSLPTYSAVNTGAFGSAPGVCTIHSGLHKRFAHHAPVTSLNEQTPNSHISGVAVSSAPEVAESSSRGRAQSRDRHAAREVSAHGTRDSADTLLERNIVYDRLMSGQELETGEMPPTYGEAIGASRRGKSPAQGEERMGRSRIHGDDAGAIWVQSASRSRSRLRD